MATKSSQLAQLKTKVAQFQSEVASELARLPQVFGFYNPRAFIAAFNSAAGLTAQRKTKGGKRFRAVITHETKMEVERLVAKGTTGAQIAKLVGISQPSVQNIKKELGLVKARK